MRKPLNCGGENNLNYILNLNTMTVEKHSDGWIVIHGWYWGTLVRERYLYYSVREAKRLFRAKYPKPDNYKK